MPELNTEYHGPARIESYTIFYDREGEPRGGVVVALTDLHVRTLARVDPGDVDLIALLTDDAIEPVGQRGSVGTDRQWRMT